VVDELRLKPGSLTILSWKTNKELYHSIMPEATKRSRISLTFRDIQTRTTGVGASRRYDMRVKEDAPSKWQKCKNVNKVPRCWKTSVPIDSREQLALFRKARENGRALWKQLAQSPAAATKSESEPQQSM